MKAETLKGHLDLLLLAVLEERPRHGYAVIDALKERSGEAFDLPEGTVYPALHRLQRARLLTSVWEEAHGRRRRVYRLTPKGRKALREKLVEWVNFAEAVRMVVGGAEWMPKPSPA